MKGARWMSAAVAALLTTACTVGPNYKRPQIAVPDQFRNANEPATPASLADQKWFDLFHDDTLKQLVSTALEHNFDMRIAAERVLEARAQASLVHANQLPTVDANVQVTSNTYSLLGPNNLLPASARTAELRQYRFQRFVGSGSLGTAAPSAPRPAARIYAASEEGRGRALTVSLIGDVMNACRFQFARAGSGTRHRK